MKNVLFAISTTLLLACHGTESTEGRTVSELKDGNALNLNALNLNALNLNALNLNALNLNALSPTTLAALQRPGRMGDLSRELVRYAASCALDATQSFDFTWKDANGTLRQEHNRGLLGLAPSWAKQMLSPIQQRWVSACLASRVNWYGTPVTVSSRGFHPQLWLPTADEAVGFTKLEGAFWGNVFGPSPHLYACHDPANDANSRAQRRDCAAGHLDDNGNPVDCGIVHIVDACNRVCIPTIDGRFGGFYSACTGDPNNWFAASFEVISVYLR